MESRLRTSLDGVASRMEENLSSLAKGMEDLRRGQSALADQLAFAQPEQGAAGGIGDHLHPFGLVRRAETAHLLSLLHQEHPQLIALVLAYLDPGKASEILGGLPVDAQPEVARRIAAMGQTSPEVLREVENALEKKLAVRSSEDYVPAGGVDSLVEILSVADRSTERNVVDAFQKTNPALAEQVKRSMFVFEDVILLDRESARRVIARVDPEEILRAMKAAPEDVQRFLWDQMPPEEGQKLRTRYEEMGRLRLSEVEKAQARIVTLIREMDESGEIVIARPGETVE